MPNVNSNKDPTSDLAAYVLKQSILNNNKFIFNGIPEHYVEFITHFSNCYMATIKDPEILYPNLVQLLEGDALDAIACTRYMPAGQALDCALSILKNRFGDPTVILEAHRSRLLGDTKVKDNLDDMAKLHTELITYKSVHNYIKPNAIVGNFDMISLILKRLSNRTSEEFMKYLSTKGFLDNTDVWYDQFVSFIDRKMGLYQCALGRSVLSRTPGAGKSPTGGNKRSVNVLTNIPTASTSDNPNNNETGTGTSKAGNGKKLRKRRRRNSKCSSDTEGSGDEKRSSVVKTSNRQPCTFCSSKSHILPACFKFIYSSRPEKQRFLNDHKLCDRCLISPAGHSCTRNVPKRSYCTSSHHIHLCDCESGNESQQ